MGIAHCHEFSAFSADMESDGAGHDGPVRLLQSCRRAGGSSVREYVTLVGQYVGSGTVDEAAVGGLVRHLGIALYGRDSSRVSCSNPNELRHVRDGFLKKKLGLDLSDGELDRALAETCHRMGTGNPHKSRLVFYYLLAERYAKLSVFT